MQDLRANTITVGFVSRSVGQFVRSFRKYKMVMLLTGNLGQVKESLVFSHLDNLGTISETVDGIFDQLIAPISATSCL